VEHSHISISSDIPVKIIGNNQQENSIQSNNFSVDKKFYSNQTITILNTNSRPGTVKVETAAVKQYKNLVRLLYFIKSSFMLKSKHAQIKIKQMGS
jgi:hypothetical protein